LAKKKEKSSMASQTDPNPGQELDLSAYKALYLEQAATFLANLRKSLNQLKDNPSDKRTLREARRAAHTLKGMSSTMRYETLAALAAELELPFQQESTLTLEQIKVLLAGCDKFEVNLHHLQEEDKG
jgi:two-component system chemotaxis sensor kinase CheA